MAGWGVVTGQRRGDALLRVRDGLIVHPRDCMDATAVGRVRAAA
ncbi:hypothetical protein [Nonomuraea lactucae]|nr:hypothetical protein [Nonomuraea lactucae]